MGSREHGEPSPRTWDPSYHGILQIMGSLERGITQYMGSPTHEITHSHDQSYGVTHAWGH